MIKLGSRVKDVVSGYQGIVIERTKRLYGTNRVTVQMECLEGGKPASFDFNEEQVEELDGKLPPGGKVLAMRPLGVLADEDGTGTDGDR